MAREATPEPPRPLRPERANTSFRAAAAQLCGDPASTYLARVERLLAEAARTGVHLAAIPSPLLTFPSAREATAAFAPLARRWAVALALGPFLFGERNGHLRRSALLLDPAGTCLGVQHETHATGPSQASQDPPAELGVWEIGVIRLGIVVGQDIRYPEVSRILCLRGANVLIHFASYSEWTEPAFMARLWREVQANQVFGLEAPVFGSGASPGRRIGGRATIHAPLEMSPECSGVLAQAPGSHEDTIVCADLDLHRRSQVLAEYSVFGQFNPTLYQRDLMNAYGVAEAQRAEPAAFPLSPPAVPAETGRHRAGAGLLRRTFHQPRAEPLAALLWWKSRPSRVHTALRGRRYALAGAPSGTRLRLGLAQTALRLEGSAEGYATHMAGLAQQAVEAGAQLLVFPEYITLPLLGLLPGALARAQGVASPDAAVHSVADEEPVTPAALFHAVSSAAARIYLATFSTLAKQHHVTVLAGTAILPGPSGGLRNVAHLFGPDGRVIGLQVKTHLVADEARWDFGRGERLEVFNTALGRIASPVCMDHTYWETARIVTQAGAEILIDPSFDFDTQGYSWYKQARGVWGRVQECPAFGVHCFLVGDLLEYHGRGHSMVCAPLEMTPAGDGILARSSTNDREEIVWADVDLAALRQFREQRRLAFQPRLYAAYLPEFYRTAAGQG